MAIVPDIVASWRRPAVVMRRKLAQGENEAGGLAALMAAMVLIFVAQWPRLAREAHIDPSVPLDARIGGALLGFVFILPLAAYGLAGLSWLALKIFRPVSGWATRLALFWALLATTPVFLLSGLVAGFVPPGPAHGLVGGLTLIVFLYLWTGNLRAVMSDAAQAEPV